MKVWVFQVEEIDANVTNINGKDYIEVDTIDVNGIKYVYLSNENDDKDYLILKVISDNGKEFYDKIESDEEFELVLLNFTKKHKEELKNI